VAMVVWVWIVSALCLDVVLIASEFRVLRFLGYLACVAAWLLVFFEADWV